MSLPWQTDFVDCAYEDPYVWWPAQRPINVHKQGQTGYVEWDRQLVEKEPDPLEEPDPLTADQMVHDFYRLGHVLQSGEAFYETNRVVGPILGPKFNDKNFKQRRKKRSRGR